jgi:hypothetical protein
VLGGVPDGTGNMLPFDPNVCYGNVALPAAPSGLTANVL